MHHTGSQTENDRIGKYFPKKILSKLFLEIFELASLSLTSHRQEGLYLR